MCVVCQTIISVLLKPRSNAPTTLATNLLAKCNSWRSISDIWYSLSELQSCFGVNRKSQNRVFFFFRQNNVEQNRLSFVLRIFQSIFSLVITWCAFLLRMLFYSSHATNMRLVKSKDLPCPLDGSEVSASKTCYIDHPSERAHPTNPRNSILAIHRPSALGSESLASSAKIFIIQLVFEMKCFQRGLHRS